MSLTVTASITSNIISATAEAVKRSIEATADIATVTKTEDHDYYQGALEFTPSDTEQTVEVKDLVCAENIVINPIPPNYGHITWNGSFLTVS